MDKFRCSHLPKTRNRGRDASCLAAGKPLRFELTKSMDCEKFSAFRFMIQSISDRSIDQSSFNQTVDRFVRKWIKISARKWEMPNEVFWKVSAWKAGPNELWEWRIAHVPIISRRWPFAELFRSIDFAKNWVFSERLHGRSDEIMLSRPWNFIGNAGKALTKGKRHSRWN